MPVWKQVVPDCHTVCPSGLQHSSRCPCIHDDAIDGIVSIRIPHRCKMYPSVICAVLILLELKICWITATCPFQQSPVVIVLKFREIGHTGLCASDMAGRCSRVKTCTCGHVDSITGFHDITGCSWVLRICWNIHACGKRCRIRMPCVIIPSLIFVLSVIYPMSMAGTTVCRTTCTAVSYTHLTLPTTPSV